MGNVMEDLCIGQLSGSGEAHLRVTDYVELASGISAQFDPDVYWRPDHVEHQWEFWSDAMHRSSLKADTQAFQ